MSETASAIPTHQPPPLSPGETTTWTVLCHLSAFLAAFGVPFGHILGPLLVWLLKRGEDPAVDAHGKEALNFQISMTIYCFILAFGVAGLMVVSIAVSIPTRMEILPFGGILSGAVLVSLFFLLEAVLIIVASIKASDGELYRYPLTLRLIK